MTRPNQGAPQDFDVNFRRDEQEKEGKLKPRPVFLRHLPPFNYLAEAAAGNTCHSLKLNK
jgi:hypothetical protein